MNTSNDSNSPAQGPRYGPYFKEDGTPAYLDLTQALAFDLVAQLSGGLLKVTLLIYIVTTQWARDKGAPKPISYAEFGHYLNLNDRSIRAILKEGVEQCVIGVVPGAGTRPARYWVRPVTDWLALTHPKHKHFTMRSTSASPSEADHFTMRSTVNGSNHSSNHASTPITSLDLSNEEKADVSVFVTPGTNATDDDERRPVEPPYRSSSQPNPNSAIRDSAESQPSQNVSASPMGDKPTAPPIAPTPPLDVHELMQPGRPTSCRRCHSAEIRAYSRDSILCLSCHEITVFELLAS